MVGFGLLLALGDIQHPEGGEIAEVGLSACCGPQVSQCLDSGSVGQKVLEDVLGVGVLG